MTRGSKDELMVWELFGDNVPKLTAAAKLIMAAIDDETIINIAGDHTDDAWEDQEGSVHTTYHKRRERKDVKSKKIKAVLKAGKTICCEACGFNFEEFYGERGRGFIECHHKKPVSEM
jgi:5-methylcytosine-specific restriction protein A